MTESTPEEAFRVVVVTLFPEFFDGPLKVSLLGKAVEQGVVVVDTINPRDFATDKHRTVDDSPYGGGPGMVLKPEPVVAAIEAARESLEAAPVVMMTPQGRRFSADAAEHFSRGKGLILVCGRYEGFDERIRAFVDAEVSIGDFVLSGGEPAALILIDAVARQREGVLGNFDSTREESFAGGLLEYPQYTRPPVFRDMAVPDILRSGDHGAVRRWRRAQALQRTMGRRPDLLEGLELTTEDRKLIEELPVTNSMESDDGG